jgi:hypothetical protein
MVEEYLMEDVKIKKGNFYRRISKAFLDFITAHY